MSFLIASPQYGGQCTSAFFTSCVALEEALTLSGVKHNWLVTTNESLIARARNTSVMEFLKHDYQKLLFLDADIEFSPEDVSKLWNMDVPIACAAYSMKRKDFPLSAWVGGKLMRMTDLTDKPNPLEVDFCGTGFLLIDRAVFDKMKESRPDDVHIEGQSLEECFTWFNTTVEDDRGKRIFLSEDYFFCKRARELGYSILMDTSIRLKHWGTWAYG